MSGTSTPTPERDAQMLAVGHQCSDPLCRLVDFLPFKCQHCNQAYCGDHFLPAAHNCAKYDESQHNRVAPSCPLCNVPVAIPPGQDANIRMERHFTTECEVMTGKAPVKKNPTCANRKCNKVLYSPIRCDTCKQQFCPQHRFPTSHNCSTATTAPTPLAGPAPSATASMNAIKRSLAARANAAAAATTRAASNAASSSSTPKTTPAPAVKASTSSSSSRPKPFSSTDRSLATPASSASSAPQTTLSADSETTTTVLTAALASLTTSPRPADDVKPKRNWLLDVRPPPSIFGAA